VDTIRAESARRSFSVASFEQRMAKIPLNTTNEFVRRRHEGRGMGDDELCHDMHAALDKGVVGSCVGMKTVRKHPNHFRFHICLTGQKRK
jgi:hypothetical protein